MEEECQGNRIISDLPILGSLLIGQEVGCSVNESRIRTGAQTVCMMDVRCRYA